VPATAVYLQGAITLLFLWTASFESILIFSGATMALNTLFAVLGIFILRHKEVGGDNELRPIFRVPFYPLPPLLFVVLTSATLIYLTIERPVEIIFSCAVLLTGAILYLLTQRWER
jgi:APA family basic amino acid/polyamine antiporter